MTEREKEEKEEEEKNRELTWRLRAAYDPRYRPREDRRRPTNPPLYTSPRPTVIQPATVQKQRCEKKKVYFFFVFNSK